MGGGIFNAGTLTATNCTIANNVMIAGHVIIHDSVNMAGGVGVHHLVTIGEIAAAASVMRAESRSAIGTLVATVAGVLFSVPCESIFDAHPDVLRTALVGVGERPVRAPLDLDAELLDDLERIGLAELLLVPAGLRGER